jgi:hypothetical protein
MHFANIRSSQLGVRITSPTHSLGDSHVELYIYMYKHLHLDKLVATYLSCRSSSAGYFWWIIFYIPSDISQLNKDDKDKK